jgi:hypothetical protein
MPLSRNQNSQLFRIQKSYVTQRIKDAQNLVKIVFLCFKRQQKNDAFLLEKNFKVSNIEKNFLKTLKSLFDIAESKPQEQKSSEMLVKEFIDKGETVYSGAHEFLAPTSEGDVKSFLNDLLKLLRENMQTKELQYVD